MKSKEYFEFVKKNESKVFAKAPFYAAYEHMTPFESAGFASRKKFTKSRIEIFYGLYTDEEELVGWCGSMQMKPNELYMVNSGIFPEHRQKGLYSKMVEATLEEAKRLGFQTVVSNHVATNNPVILAKLKLGFVISGFEILDEIGAVVKLTYFLNPLRREVMSYRVGESYPSAPVKKLLRLK